MELEEVIHRVALLRLFEIKAEAFQAIMHFFTRQLGRDCNVTHCTAKIELLKQQIYWLVQL